ncbi:hypothetical protein [Metabacillus endolithicus]|uniref:hypothetical protein n=1 Tax=Metabacillus endolithicus TaxID=1535204 RepID=UPI001FFA8C53|nr:hypothetical protein [Metabacillus endolithicus]UPG63838.1 hypothetical protein MVE64_01330 [Metabacillus endolithicus]
MNNWETLPSWFWAVYYLFLLITLVAAIFSVLKRVNKSLSILGILITFSLPIIGVVNSIGRAEGMNEFEHLVSQIQQGAMWSIFTLIGFMFLFLWWVLFLRNIK